MGRPRREPPEPQSEPVAPAPPPAPASGPAPVVERGARPSVFGAVRRILLVVAVALVLGGLTSWAQLVLPRDVVSLANSAGGWMIPTAALVLLLARSSVEAAISGAAAFVALTVGYAVVSGWRDLPFDPTTWAILGVLAGPVVGWAAHALRGRGRRMTLGTAVLAGVLVGEGVYGLTVVAESTSPVWWWIEIAIGGIALTVGALRARPWGLALVALTGTVLVAAAFWSAFVLLPIFVFR